MLKITFKIEFNKELFYQKFLKRIIIKRAYKGYCKYVEGCESKKPPLPVSEFANLEFWKIKFFFQMYFCLFKGVIFSQYNKPFVRSAILNY